MPKMSDKGLANWGRRFSISLPQVKHLQKLYRRRIRLDTHASNGDPHPSKPVSRDKNENAQLWAEDVEAADRELTDFATKKLGFTGVDFRMSFIPELSWHGETNIVPPDVCGTEP